MLAGISVISFTFCNYSLHYEISNYAVTAKTDLSKVILAKISGAAFLGLKPHPSSNYSTPYIKTYIRCFMIVFLLNHTINCHYSNELYKSLYKGS